MVEKCVSRLWNQRQLASPESHGPVSGYLPRTSHGSPWPHEYPHKNAFGYGTHVKLYQIWGLNWDIAAAPGLSCYFSQKIRQESSRESCWAHPIRPIPTIPCPLSSPAFKSTPCPWRPSKSCHRAKTGTASQRAQRTFQDQVKLRPSEIFIKQPVSLSSLQGTKDMSLKGFKHPMPSSRWVDGE